jgi:PAS domain S-box-containing protein
LDAAPVAIVVVDGAGQIVLANAETERLFGYSRAALLASRVEALVPVRFRDAHPGLRGGYMAAPKKRSMGAGRDVFGVRADGSEVPIEIGLNPIATEHGTFVLAAIVDITERKRAEEQVRAVNRELESFSYSISHDLRAPLRAIGGFSEILHREYAPALDDEGRRLLKIVQDAAARMALLIDELLKFTALGRKALAKAPVDMTALAREVATEQLEHAATEADLRVEELPAAHGDATLLRQVWENLISNALKYSSGRTPAVVRVGGKAETDQIIFFVEDNGVGFNMKHYDKLFRVFQRLHHADEFPGTGVGLAIVERIVTRHGGRVWANGALNEGAVFSFALPRGDSM